MLSKKQEVMGQLGFSPWRLGKSRSNGQFFTNGYLSLFWEGRVLVNQTGTIQGVCKWPLVALGFFLF